jgi:hypothetical protein
MNTKKHESSLRRKNGDRTMQDRTMDLKKDPQIRGITQIEWRDEFHLVRAESDVGGLYSCLPHWPA